MIASRTTWLVKPGCTEKALDLMKAHKVDLGGHVVRIYTPKFSPELLVFEFTSENVQEHEAWWAAYSASPAAAAFYPKWSELVERRMGEEIWEVTELR
jgi:hypothetical protein